MRSVRRICIPFVLIYALTLLAGCSSNNSPSKNNSAAWDLANAEPIYAAQWPENKYTSQIIKPENGEIDYIYDFSDCGRYAVFMKDLSKEESADYIEKLKEQGYSEVASNGNDVSVGTILQKDNVYLSISYSDTILGIAITIESDN